MAGLSMFHRAPQLGTNSIFDDDADTTATDNVDHGPTTLRKITGSSVNNAIVYLLLWDDTDPVVGTDAPDFQFPIPAGDSTLAVRTVMCGGDVVFDNGLSWAAATTGGTACTGDPTTPIDVYANTNGGN